MTPEPVPIGLHLCHDLVVHAETLEVSLHRVFRTLRSPLYPLIAPPFWVFAGLTGPVGRGILRVVIFHLDDRDLVYIFETPVEFPDRFTPVYFRLRLSTCRFPSAGAYEMMLLVDQDVIAQRVFHVLTEGSEP